MRRLKTSYKNKAAKWIWKKNFVLTFFQNENCKQILNAFISPSISPMYLRSTSVEE
jgi:hypothetical protein